jgi:hypothetical protein
MAGQVGHGVAWLDKVRNGRFDAVGSALSRFAEPRYGWVGQVWQVLVRPVTSRKGLDRLGRQGMARQGLPRHGRSWHGLAWLGRFGVVRHGPVRYAPAGVAWSGLVRRATESKALARQAWLGVTCPGLGWSGAVGRGRLGVAR